MERTTTDPIKQYLEKASGKRYDITAAIYQLILDSPDPFEAFRYFLENADDIHSSKKEAASPFFSRDQLDTLRLNLEQYITGYIQKQVRKHLDETTFYQTLWNWLTRQDGEFSTEEERIYALYRLWNDGRIPYFQLPESLEMDDEQFQKIVLSKRQEIKKIIFILNYPFEQRTQHCSLLIDLLDACESREEKSVLLAQMLYSAERKNLLDLLLQKKKKQ